MNKDQKQIRDSAEESIMSPEGWEFATDKFKELRKVPKMEVATQFKEYRTIISEKSNKFKVVCMECGKKFKSSTSYPTCPKCKSTDIELDEAEVDEKHGGPHYAGSRHKKIERDKYRKRKSWSAMKDENDPELEEGTVLQITDVDKWTTEIYKGLKAGWKSVAKSTLGGDENVAIMIKVTVEPEKDWPSKILHNASFGMVRIATDGTMEMFASGHKIKNMRKTKVKSAKDVVSKINKWLSTIDVQEVYSEGKSAYDKQIADFLKRGGTIKKLKVGKKEVAKAAAEFKKSHKKMTQKEIELAIQDKLDQEQDEGREYPKDKKAHLAKIMKKVADVKKKKEKKFGVKITDRTPKGYGPNEDAEIEEAKILKPGTKVQVAHPAKGKGMVTGKIVRYDKGGPHSPFYVVDIGERQSEKVPAHKIKEEADLGESQELQAKMALDDAGIEYKEKNNSIVIKKKDLKRAQQAFEKSFKKGGWPTLKTEENMEITEVLKTKDKSVIDSFYDQKPKEGRLMSTDGKTLDKVGMGGQEIAKWVNGKIKITAVSDVKSTETILKYMKASIPKNNFEEFVGERDYRKEYDNYQGKPEQIARRSSRNKARRIMGDEAEKGKDVGHKDNNPLNNDKKNLRNEDPSKNRREPRLRKKMESFVGFATESTRNDIHNGSISAGIELEKYAKKSGGIDKADMLATAAILKKGKLPSAKQIPGDTDPRDKVFSIIGKHLNKQYLKKYKGLSPALDNAMKEQWEIDERKLTPTEIKRREEIAQELDDAKFKKQYGDDWKNVKMGVATNMAKKESFDTWFEARYKYKVDHKTYTSAVEEALLVADKAGYEVDMDDYFNQIATGPRKPGEGKTNTFKIGLEKGGKEQKKRLQIQIYGKGKHGYELNCYIQ